MGVEVLENGVQPMLNDPQLGRLVNEGAFHSPLRLIELNMLK